MEGGAAVPLGAPGVSAGSSWGEDGNIVDGIFQKGLFRIPDNGGAATPVKEPAEGEIIFAAPQIPPGGKAILLAVYPTGGEYPDKTNIEVLSLGDHRRKILVQGATSARYLATSNKSGYLVYANRSTLFAVPFDLERLEMRGTPVRVLEDVGFYLPTGESQFDVSSTGTMVYRKSSGGPTDRLNPIQWVDATGKKKPLVSKPGEYGFVRLSPDGKKLAVEGREGGKGDIQVYDLQRDLATNLTVGGGFNDPVWTPDSQFVVFSSPKAMMWARADGASQPQPLLPIEHTVPFSITRDGKRLAYFQASSNRAQIWTVPLENTGGQLKAGEPEQFLKSPFIDLAPSFSPDGKWLAYSSRSSGSPDAVDDVYVRAFPDNGMQWKISNGGGVFPIWSPNGHDLFFFNETAGEMAVSYSVKDGTFVPEGKPRMWQTKFMGEDLSIDGKQLIVNIPVDSPDSPKAEHEVVLLQNFFDELRRKVPLTK